MSMGINMLKFILLNILGVFLVFIACDQTIYHEVYIRNSTSYHLDLIFEISQNDQLDSMKLDTGTEYLIYKYSKYIESADLNYTLNYIKLLYKDSLIYEQNPIDQRLWVYNDPGYYLTIVDSNLSVVGD